MDLRMMARLGLTKNERNEKCLVDEFLRYKGIQFRKLQSLREFRPGFAASGIAGPDTRAECLVRGKWLTLGIELTEYQSDRTSNGSPARQRQAAWTRVWGIMRRDYIPRFPELQDIFVSVNLHEKSPNKGDLELIARELKDFLFAVAPGVSNNQMFCGWDPVARKSCFAAWPKLKRYVTSIHVYRMPGCEGDVPWVFGDADWVGVDPAQVAKIISRKSRLRRKYDTEMDECWLLICASGATAADGGGPADPGANKLCCPDVRRAARHSGFQKGIFWERVEKWDFEFWEGEPPADPQAP